MTAASAIKRMAISPSTPRDDDRQRLILRYVPKLSARAKSSTRTRAAGAGMTLFFYSRLKVEVNISVIRNEPDDCGNDGVGNELAPELRARRGTGFAARDDIVHLVLAAHAER